jgi:site-specific DNA recombinase
VFDRFIEIGSGTELARVLTERGVTTARGHRIYKKFVYRMLNIRVYIGEAVHKGTSYPGEHKAIIDRETWDKVPGILTKRSAQARSPNPRRHARAASGIAE